MGYTDTPIEMKPLVRVCDPTVGLNNEPLYRDRRVDETREHLRETAKRNAQASKKQTAKPYKTGDWVLKRTSRRSDAAHRKTRKLILLYEGPYIVERSSHPNSYTIHEPGKRVTQQANTRILQPYRNPRLRNLDIRQVNETPLDPPDDEEEEHDRRSDRLSPEPDSDNSGRISIEEDRRSSSAPAVDSSQIAVPLVRIHSGIAKSPGKDRVRQKGTDNGCQVAGPSRDDGKERPITSRYFRPHVVHSSDASQSSEPQRSSPKLPNR